MKNAWKRLLPTGLSVAVLTLSASSAIAATGNSAPASPSPHQPASSAVHVDYKDRSEKEQEYSFMSVIGKIVSIEERENGTQLAAIETNEGEPVHFILSDETYIASDLEIGTEIMAFYDARLPVIMIYPPQYGAIAIADVDPGSTHKVDYFDENLVSSDGDLKLNLSEDSEILNKDGSAFEGEIEGHKLFVTYGASTRSIPAQTTPENVIVLGGPEQLDHLDPTGDVELNTASYAPVFGEIKDIQPHGTEEQYQLVTVEQEDSSIINLVVSQQTYVYNENELKKGMEIVAFYDANAPAIMIYPPQYGVIAIAEVNEGRSFMVDVFDEHLLSQDGSLILHIGEETEIIRHDGTPFDGDLTGHTLFVDYGIVALSYPAQTTPDTIVVLDVDVVEETPLSMTDPAESILDEPGSGEATESIHEPLAASENQQIIVNGEVIDSPAPFMEGDHVMVPLRAIAEAAGFELTWEHETKSTTLGKHTSLQVGASTYTDVNGENISLQAAPVLVDGVTYVPLNFFPEVLHVHHVDVTSEGISIDHEEK